MRLTFDIPAGLVEDLAGLAFAKIKSRRSKDKSPDYRCAVSSSAVRW